MRDEITYYLIELVKPWAANAPGGAVAQAGALLYIGEGKPKRGSPGQEGWTPEGWHRILGHGMSEVIPTEYLSVCRRRFIVADQSDLTWEDMG